MRHSAGASLIEARDLLGHSTIRMTGKYAYLAPDNVRNAVARLEGLPHFRHTTVEKAGLKCWNCLIRLVGGTGFEPVTPAV